MAQRWYYARGGQKIGPVTSQELRYLAASGTLQPTDLVWVEGNDRGREARSVVGLFPAANGERRPDPPPLPEGRIANAGSTEAGITAGGSLAEKLGNLTETTKAAARLAAAQARKAHLVNVTLRAAYLDLGRDIYAAGRYRDELPDQYAEIAEVERRIEQIASAQGRVSPAKGLADRATGAAAGVKAAAQTKALSMTKESLLRRLGESCFERYGEKSGPGQQVRSITESLSRMGELDQEIGRASKVRQGTLVTPRRFLIGAVGVGSVLLALTLGRIAFHENPGHSAIRDGSVPLMAGEHIDKDTGDSDVRGHEVVEEEARGRTVVKNTEPDDAGKGGERATTSPVPRNRQGGPPYVVEAEGSPRLIVRRQGLRIALRGRLWEQRLEFGGLCFSPDGKLLAAGGALREGLVRWRGAVLLVDAATGRTITAMQELHDRQVTCICFSPDGRLMATGSGGVVKVWDTDPPSVRGSFEFTHPKVAKMTGIYHEVKSLLFSRDGKYLIAVGGLDSSPPIVGTLMAWDYLGGTPAYSAHPGYRLESASLSSDGQTLVTGSATGRIDFWMSATGEHITMKLDMGIPTGRAIVRTQPGGERVVLGVETSGPFDDRRTPYKLNSIDFKSGSRCWSNDGTTPVLKGFDVSPDGRLIVCGGNGIDLWDSDTGEIVASIDGFRSPVTCIAYSPDGKRFAASVPSGDNAGNVWVWDIGAVSPGETEGAKRPPVALLGQQFFKTTPMAGDLVALIDKDGAYVPACNESGEERSDHRMLNGSLATLKGKARGTGNLYLVNEGGQYTLVKAKYVFALPNKDVTRHKSVYCDLLMGNARSDRRARDKAFQEVARAYGINEPFVLDAILLMGDANNWPKHRPDGKSKL